MRAGSLTERINDNESVVAGTNECETSTDMAVRFTYNNPFFHSKKKSKPVAKKKLYCKYQSPLYTRNFVKPPFRMIISYIMETEY